MTQVAVVLLAFIASQEPLGDASANQQPIRILKFLVSRDQLSTIRPKNQVTHQMQLERFDRLWSDYVARAKHASFRSPVACTLTARVDIAGNRLVGTGKWVVPAGRGEFIRFAPWNLTVLAFRIDNAQTDWGMTPAGELLVRARDERSVEIEMDWELAPLRQLENWSFDLRVPACAIAQLALSVPPDWKIQTSSRLERGARDVAVASIPFGGLPGITFDLTRHSAHAQPLGEMTWHSEQLYRFEENAIELHCEIQLEAVHKHVEQIRLVVDEDVRIQDPRVSTPANWRRTDAGPGKTGWIVEFRRPPIGPIRFRSVFAAEPDRVWHPPAITVEGAVARGNRLIFSIAPSMKVGNLTPGEYRQTFVGLGETERYDLVFVGSADAAPPGLQVAPGLPIVDVDHEVFLAASRERLDLTAQITWRCQYGIVHQPRVSIPAGWELDGVDIEGDDRRTPYTSEPEGTGGMTVWLQLARPLIANQRVRATIRAHQSPGLRTPPKDPYAFVLPDIRPMDFPPTSESVYRLMVDPSLPHRLDRLPPPAQLPTAKLPDQMTAMPGETYTFQYRSPRNDLALEVLAQPLRFSAASRQLWDWNAGHWHANIALSIAVRQGFSRSFEIVTDRKLPDGFQWTVEGSRNVIESSELASTKIKAGRDRHRYALQFGVPVNGDVDIRGHWVHDSRSADVPLIDFPAAESFAGTIHVSSRSGIDIAQTGLVETAPETEPSSLEMLVWSANYSRLPRSARLSLVARDDVERSSNDSFGRAAARCRTLIHDRHVVHHWLIALECRRSGRFLIGLPNRHDLWQVSLDGESVQPRILDGFAVVADDLATGSHILEVVTSSPVPDFVGLPAIELSSPVQAWDATSLNWQIERAGLTFALSGPSVPMTWSITEDSEPMHERNRTGPFIGDPAQVSAAVAILEDAFAGLSRDAPSMSQSMLAIAERLPAGWTFVIDRDAVDEAAGAAATDPSPLAFAEWLVRERLVVHVSGVNILLSNRIFDLESGNTPSPGWIDWLANSVRRKGADLSGRFVSAAVLAAEPDFRFRTHSELSRRAGGLQVQTHFASFHGAQAKGTKRVLLVPQCWVERCSKLAALLVAVAMMLAGTAWPARHCRRTLAGSLVVFVVVESTGGLCDALFHWPVLAAMTVPAMLLVRRGWSEHRAAIIRTGASVAVLAFFVVDARAQSEAPKTYQIIVPFDLDKPAGTTPEVIVPDALLQLIQARQTSVPWPLLVGDSDYNGAVAEDRPGQIRWRGRLSVVVDNRNTFPSFAPLKFARIDPVQILVDGEKAHFRPAGVGGALDVMFARPGEQTIEIEFFTPIFASDSQQETDFSVPPAAKAKLRLELGMTGIELGKRSQPRGIDVDRTPQSDVLVGNLGPHHDVRLRWSPKGTLDTAADRIAVTSAYLLDIGRNDGRDSFLRSIFRYKIDGSGVRELTLHVSPELLVRFVDADGLRDWQLVTADSIDAQPGQAAAAPRNRLVLNFDPPRVGELDVRIQSLAMVPNAGRIEIPELAPLNVREDSGLIGVRVPAGWNCKAADETPQVVPSSVEAFVAEWEAIAGQPPGEGVILAGHFHDRPFDFPSVIEPPTAQWSAKLHMDVLPLPDLESAAVSCDGRIEVTKGGLRAVTIDLPIGFQLVSIESSGIHQWFQMGQTVNLLPRSDIDGTFDFVVSGHWAGKPAGATRTVVYPLQSFGLRGADSTQTLWKLRIPAGWDLQLDNLKEVRNTSSEGSEHSLELSSDAAVHSLRASMHPVSIELEAKAITVARVSGEEVTFDGRIDLRFDPATPRRIRLTSPIEYPIIEWISDSVRLQSSSVEGNRRIWTFETNRPNVSNSRIDWRVVQKNAGSADVRVPGIALEQQAFTHEWVAVYANGGDRTFETDAVALQGLGSYDGAVALPVRFALDDPEKLVLFKADAPNWELVLRSGRSSTVRNPFTAIGATIDVLQTGNTTVTGRGVWEIVDHAAGAMDFFIPDDHTVDSLLIDGTQVPVPRKMDGRIACPVFRKGHRQRVELNWSGTINPSTGRLSLPRVAEWQNSLHPTLICVRLPGPGHVQVNDAEKFDRATWLIERLGRFLDELEYELLTRDASARRATTFTANERIVEFMARGQRLTNQFEEVIRLNKMEQPILAKWESLEARRDALLRQYDVEALYRRARTLPADIHDAKSIPSRAWAGNASCFLTENVPAELTIRNFAADWRLPSLTMHQGVRVVSALTGLLLLILPGTWTGLRKYWPALVLGIGVAWLRWGDTPWIGAVLLAAAVLGAVWILYNWSRDTVTILPSTIYEVRPSRLSPPS